MCRIKNNYIILDARICYIKKNYICARDLAAFWDRGLRMQPRRGARSATWLSREFVRFYANFHNPLFPQGHLVCAQWHAGPYPRRRVTDRYCMQPDSPNGPHLTQPWLQTAPHTGALGPSTFAPRKDELNKITMINPCTYCTRKNGIQPML